MLPCFCTESMLTPELLATDGDRPVAESDSEWSRRGRCRNAPRMQPDALQNCQLNPYGEEFGSCDCLDLGQILAEVAFGLILPSGEVFDAKFSSRPDIVDGEEVCVKHCQDGSCRGDRKVPFFKEQG